MKHKTTKNQNSEPDECIDDHEARLTISAPDIRGRMLARYSAKRDRLYEKVRDISDRLLAIQLKTQIEYLDSKIDKIRNKMCVVTSEHALLRYIQRVMNIDIDQIQNELETMVNKSYSVLGDGVYKAGEYKAHVSNGVIVTVKNQ